MPLLKCIIDRSSHLANALRLEGVQVQVFLFFQTNHFRMAACIPKLLVSEYVLQMSDLCLCHR